MNQKDFKPGTKFWYIYDDAVLEDVVLESYWRFVYPYHLDHTFPEQDYMECGYKIGWREKPKDQQNRSCDCLELILIGQTQAHIAEYVFLDEREALNFSNDAIEDQIRYKEEELETLKDIFAEQDKRLEQLRQEEQKEQKN
jgi:hypothetical protein